jgi:single-stranded-DNA-specific exonuclease
MAVAWSEGWHRGVVGIAAGRLARRFHRPTVLLSVEGDTATGSGRSVPGIGLHAFLSRWRDAYLSFGGHAQAIGLTVESRRLDELRQAWQEAASEAFDPELLKRRLEYELQLTAAEVTPQLLAELRRLQPHGQGNPLPLARVAPLRLAGEPRQFGRGHLSGRVLGENGRGVHFVAWGWAERRQLLAGRFETLAHVEYDSYRGAPVLRLVDARPL